MGKQRLNRKQSHQIDMKKNLALSIIALSASVFGWEAKLSVEPTVARVGEPLTITLTLQDGKNFARPNQIAVDGIRTGPFNSQSSQTSWVNGKTTRSFSLSCQAIADKAGDFTIPLSYTHDGETRDLQASLKILESNDSALNDLNKMFFAKFSASSDSVYLQEPIDFEIEIFTVRGAEITNQIGLDNLPESGFDEFKWESVGAEERVVDGEIYIVRRLRCRTRAITAGTFDFNPQISVQVVTENRRRSRDPFDDFFGARTQTQTLQLPIDKTVLTVLPLPQENKPANFSEGVGDFDFQVQNIPSKVLQGDPITVRMIVRGNGNLQNIKVPVFESNRSVKSYETSRIQLTQNEAVFEQILMINDPDLKELPAREFSWFDPQSQSYKTVTRGPFPITVEPNESAQAQIVSENIAVKTKTEILGEDILYLKSLPQNWKNANESSWFRKPAFFAILPLPAIFAALIAFLVKKNQAQNSDVSEKRKREAAKNSNPALKAAESAAKSNDPQTFYTEIWSFITRYFSAKLKLGAGEISEIKLNQALETSGLEKETLNDFRKTIQICELSRYGGTPKSSTEEMNSILATINIVIKHCERKLK